MKQTISFAAILLIILTAITCKDDNPVDPPEPPIPVVSDTLTILVEQVSHRSISVNIKSTDNGTGRLIGLRRITGTDISSNYTLVSSYSANTLDTTIIDDNEGSGLELDTDYGYYAVRVDSISKPTDTSNVITAKTLTATSHDFTAQIFTFGDFSSSILNDVAIIDENNIWAVGQIFLNDSSGQSDPSLYNTLQWNGNDFEIKRATNVALNAIYAFSDNDIWACSSAPYHYDGNDWQPYNITGLFNGHVYAIWGSSSQDLYIVGGNGAIAYFNGSSWRSIESGTDLTLTDIYAINSNEIYVSGVETSIANGIMLKGNSNGFQTVISSINSNAELFEKLSGRLSTVWLDDSGIIYTAGNNLFWNIHGKWDYLESHDQIQRGYIYSIRGNAGNDYVMAGDRNTLLHYNGIDWKQIGIYFNSTSSIILRKVEQKGNIVAAVGFTGRQAIIIILKR